MQDCLGNPVAFLDLCSPEAILDAHYLGRDVQLAEAAVLKLEKRTKL